MKLLLLLSLFYILHLALCRRQLRQYSDENVEEVPSLPKISRERKWEMIRQSGQDPTSRRRASKGFRTERSRRLAEDRPWRRSRPLAETQPPPKPAGPPRALPPADCPRIFDAVTRGFNGITYLFAGDRVYTSWTEDGLPQKASFSIPDLFSGGPPHVTAATTNTRSGVTTLFAGRTSYRFRWNEEGRRFMLAKNSPRQLNETISLTPTAAFEWQGHQVLLNGENFITYDAYWNLATFESKTQTYFPGVPRDLVGILLDRGPTVLYYTRRNTVQIYERTKHRVAAEIPVNVADYAGCLRERPPQPIPKKDRKRMRGERTGGGRKREDAAARG